MPVKRRSVTGVGTDRMKTLQPLEVLRELLRSRFPEKTERARLKKRAAEQKQFGRVDALAREILPKLSPDELKRLGRHIRKELALRRAAPKPAHRPKRSKEDRDKEERLAQELHTSLTKTPFEFTSGDADELIGLTMFADKRTAQRRRKAYAEKLRKTRDKKPRK